MQEKINASFKIAIIVLIFFGLLYGMLYLYGLIETKKCFESEMQSATEWAKKNGFNEYANADSLKIRLEICEKIKRW